MKLNKFSLSIFFLILIIFYPIIYYYSEKKITNSNLNLTTYKYRLTGIIRIVDIDLIPKKLSNQAIKLNKKYFDNHEKLYFFPERKIFLAKKKIPALNLDSNNIEEDFQYTINLQKNLEIQKPDDLLIVLDNEIVFNFNANSLYEFIINELKQINNSYKSQKKCSGIDQNIYRLKRIDSSILHLEMSVHDQVKSSGLINPDKVFLNFKDCFRNKMNKFTPDLIGYLKIIFDHNSREYEKNIKDFIENNQSFFENNKKATSFESDMLLFKNEILFNLGNIKLDVKFLDKPQIEIEKVFQKNFNIYVVSFILSFIVDLLSFYLLFFLKNYLKFLQKIF